MVTHTLRFAVGLTAMNLKASFALRGAFWFQALGMLLNNVFFFSLWWIFFHRFEEIRGWRVDDMLALFGVVTGSGKLSLSTLPLALTAVAVSGAVFTASGVILHSLAFWLGRVEGLARQLWEFLITFSIYPRPLFAGALKLMLFTLIPAGFIGYLPVELLREFTWLGLAAALSGAVLYVALALLVFDRGLRQYESGSRFGVRA